MMMKTSFGIWNKSNVPTDLNLTLTVIYLEPLFVSSLTKLLYRHVIYIYIIYIHIIYVYRHVIDRISRSCHAS